MFTPKQYELRWDYAGNPAGTVVYDFMGCDYGLANDDTRMTGVRHESVTLNSDGSYPAFTVPVTALKPL